MKKLISAMALGAVLVAGLFFAQDNTTDLAMDAEPSILSIGNPSYKL